MKCNIVPLSRYLILVWSAHWTLPFAPLSQLPFTQNSYSRRSSVSSMSPDAMEEITEEEGDAEGKPAKRGNKQDDGNRRASGAEPSGVQVVVVSETAQMRPGSRAQVGNESPALLSRCLVNTPCN